MNACPWIAHALCRNRVAVGGFDLEELKVSLDRHRCHSITADEPNRCAGMKRHLESETKVAHTPDQAGGN
jgi:hypothetical protein